MKAGIFFVPNRSCILSIMLIDSSTLATSYMRRHKPEVQLAISPEKKAVFHQKRSCSKTICKTQQNGWVAEWKYLIICLATQMQLGRKPECPKFSPKRSSNKTIPLSGGSYPSMSVLSRIVLATS